MHLLHFSAAFEVDIKPPGDKHVKSLTSNALFSCQVKNAGDSDVKIEWFDKDSKLIPEDQSSRLLLQKIFSIRIIYVLSKCEKMKCSCMKTFY